MHSTSFESRNPRYNDPYALPSLENVADEAYGEGYRHGQQDARGAGQYSMANGTTQQGLRFPGAQNSPLGFDYQTPQMRNFTGQGAFQAPSTNDFMNGMQSNTQTSSSSNPMMQMMTMLSGMMSALMGQMFGGGPGHGQPGRPFPGHSHPQPANPCHPGHGQPGIFPPPKPDPIGIFPPPSCGHPHPPSHAHPHITEYSRQSDKQFASVVQTHFDALKAPGKPEHITAESLKAVMAGRTLDGKETTRDEKAVAKEMLARATLFDAFDKGGFGQLHDGKFGRRDIQRVGDNALGNSNPVYGGNGRSSSPKRSDHELIDGLRNDFRAFESKKKPGYIDLNDLEAYAKRPLSDDPVENRRIEIAQGVVAKPELARLLDIGTRVKEGNQDTDGTFDMDNLNFIKANYKEKK
ncbi:hypothetical protein OOJ96_04010 [Pseudomonas sp. 15FMM2]|uniref:Uncharacterized protein n=2 Tax=Pseudomonas imrae TaxID=2992837 RepID=A0ACC7P859_9PSED